MNIFYDTSKAFLIRQTAVRRQEALKTAQGDYLYRASRVAPKIVPNDAGTLYFSTEKKEVK